MSDKGEADQPPDEQRSGRGWYQDPEGPPGATRYWTGYEWTARQKPHQSLVTAAFVTAVLFPLVGFVLGIVLLGKDRVGPGLGAIATSIVVGLIGLSLLAGDAVEDLAGEDTVTESTAAVDRDADTGDPSAAGLREPVTVDTETGPLKVTVTKVVDPAKPDPYTDRPDSGNRYVGIEVRVENSGNERYDGVQSSEPLLVGDDGEQAKVAYAESKDCEGFLDQLAAGARQTACHLFELADDAQPDRFEWTLDDLDGDTGRWDVRRGRR